jgi:hypothetical protein
MGKNQNPSTLPQDPERESRRRPREIVGKMLREMERAKC